MATKKLCTIQSNSQQPNVYFIRYSLILVVKLSTTAVAVSLLHHDVVRFTVYYQTKLSARLMTEPKTEMLSITVIVNGDFVVTTKSLDSTWYVLLIIELKLNIGNMATGNMATVISIYRLRIHKSYQWWMFLNVSTTK